MINERLSKSLNLSFTHKKVKTSDSFIHIFLYVFCTLKKNPSDLLIPSFLTSDVSELLRLLTKNERPWANPSGRSQKMSKWANCSFFKQISHQLIFSQKTSDWLRKLMSKFPALLNLLEFESSVKVRFSRDWPHLLDQDQTWNKLQLVIFIQWSEFYKYCTSIELSKFSDLL